MNRYRLRSVMQYLALFFLFEGFAHAAAGTGFDFGAAITGAASGLVTNYEPIFKPLGDEIFVSLTTVMIISYGVKIIFATSHHAYQHAVEQGKAFLGSWLAAWVCLAFYDTPLWGGLSIHQAIPAMATFLTRKIGLGIVDTAIADMTSVITGSPGNPGMPAPGLFNPPEWITYIWVTVQATLLETALILASSFGFVAMGIGALFGPIMIPFLIVPQMRHWFYAWISYMVKFAMFTVVAAAQAFIWATAADNFLTTAIGGNYTLPHLLTCAIGLGIITLGTLLGLLSTGAIVNDLFGGSAHGGGSIGVMAAIKGLF